MEYLCRQFNVDSRLALTVHDEIRYLAKEEDKYRCAMALQVANIWTRAMFSQQMGIDDLPQSCAYFSAVDIDHVLRKEVDMDCVTPSHPEKIPSGESLDILQLLAKGEKAVLDPKIESAHPPQPGNFEYAYRQPVMESLKTPRAMQYLRAQVASDTTELNKIVKEIKPAAPSSKIYKLNDSPEPPKRRGRKPKSAAQSYSKDSGKLANVSFDGKKMYDDNHIEAMRGWGHSNVGWMDTVVTPQSHVESRQ